MFRNFATRGLVVLLWLAFLPSTQANETGLRPMSFKVWKNQQVVEATNKVVRLSNAIHIEKQNRTDKQEAAEKTAPEATDKIASEAKEKQEQMENKLQGALENLQFAKELTMEDYYLVHLYQFRNNAEAMNEIVSDMEPEEVTSLLRTIMRLREKDESAKDQKMASPYVGSGSGEAAL